MYVRFVLIVPVPATALKVSITVQFAPGARTAPVQLLVVMEKYRVARVPLPPAPPGAGRVTPVTVTLALPAGAVLVSVTVPWALDCGYTVNAG